MSQIRIDPQFVANLATRIQRTSSELRSLSSRGTCRLTSAPTVANAYDDLGEKWDYRRDQLAGALDELAGNLIKAKNTFQASDAQLAADLSQD